MNEEQLQSSEQIAIRTLLRAGGAAIFAVGSIFTAIGLISFFSTFASFAQPDRRAVTSARRAISGAHSSDFRMLAAGVFMLKLGFLGAIARYVAGESAPVAKDIVNYMGENTQSGVKAVAKSVTEGVLEATARFVVPLVSLARHLKLWRKAAPRTSRVANHLWKPPPSPSSSRSSSASSAC